MPIKHGTTNVVRVYRNGYQRSFDQSSSGVSVDYYPLGKICNIGDRVVYNGEYFDCIQNEVTEVKDTSGNLMHKRTIITFNANGGSGGSSQTKTWGVENITQPPDPTRTNYNFLGWSTSSSATTPNVTFPLLAPNTNVTYYAVWEAMIPTRWLYIGTSSSTINGDYEAGTFSATFCYASSEINNILTSNRPPSNYAPGFVMRVHHSVSNKFGSTDCGYMYFEAVIE